MDFESLAAIKEKFPTYADKFDPFAVESTAMSQYLGTENEFFPHIDDRFQTLGEC